MTDDIRPDDASVVPPEEDEAAESPEADGAPEVEEPVDWEKRYRERERTISRQGDELSLLRKQVALTQRQTPRAEAPDAADIPPSVQQELDFYRSRMADVEKSEITTEYGEEFSDAMDFFMRAANLDPSRKGVAAALVATINRLAQAEAPEAPPPRPKPKAPAARMETNRPDTAPPADIEKVRREAEQTPTEANRRRFIGALLDAAGVNR